MVRLRKPMDFNSSDRHSTTTSSVRDWFLSFPSPNGYTLKTRLTGFRNRNLIPLAVSEKSPLIRAELQHMIIFCPRSTLLILQCILWGAGWLIGGCGPAVAVAAA